MPMDENHSNGFSRSDGQGILKAPHILGNGWNVGVGNCGSSFDRVSSECVTEDENSQNINGLINDRKHDKEMVTD
jgi:hypothetical protein